MDPDSRKLCSRCQSNVATNYICYGGQELSEELCNECVAKENSFASSFIKEMQASNCEFCGGQVSCGGGSSLASITGMKPGNLWMCFLCSQEYHTYTLKQFDTAPENESQSDQLRWLKGLISDVAAHMKRYVIQRSN